MKKLYFFFLSTLLILNICYAQWNSLGTGITASPRSIWNISVVDENIVWEFATHTIDFTPIFNGNTAPNGGALYSQTFGEDISVRITNSSFKENECHWFGNVAAYHWAEGAYGNVLIDNCLFENNTSAAYSAGIDIGSGPGAAPSEYTITNCIFKNNDAEMIGGALALWGELGTEAGFLIENCLFGGNQAGDEAGAIWVFNGSNDFTATVSHCEFIENLSPTGAAIGSNNNGLINPSEPAEAKFKMNNCLISDNIGDNAVSILNFPDFQMLNCTVADNTGGSIEISNHSGLTLQNTILYNIGKTEFEALAFNITVISKGGNLIGDDSFSAHALPQDLQSTDPLFTGMNDYHLSDESPAIDKGIDTGNLSEFDLDGNNRVNGCVDIGAYESEIIVSTECVTGAKEVLVDNNLSFSPNPTTGYLNIQLPETISHSVEVNIFDTQGKLISTQPYSNGQSIDVQGLASGMYWVKVSEGERIIGNDA